MNALLAAIQDVVATENVEPETEVQPDSTQPYDGTIETQLAQEISTLWSDHVRLCADHKTTAKELRQIRASLAARLYDMKSLLSRPGRLGQWRGWLRQQGIPRSTADRLASRHAETLGTDNENVPGGAISSSPEDSAEKLAKSVWQRFGKTLADDVSVVRFIGCIVTASGIPHEQRAEGLVIFNPGTKAASGLPTIASHQDDLAPDEASAIKEEPRDDAAKPVETGQVADVGSGYVQ
jgi:hypothetical protein